MTVQTTKTNQTIEVRSKSNDKAVLTFTHSEESGVNLITAGYNKVCAAFGIDRMNADSRYYVTKA